MLYVFLSLIQNTYVYCRYVNNKKENCWKWDSNPRSFRNGA